jgi:hypothetical protein
VVSVSERVGWRRRTWLIIGGVVVLLLAWGALLATKTVSAYHHDQQGLARLEQVKNGLTPDDLTSAGSVQLLDAARAEFASAQSDLSSPLFTPITIVPVVGRQVRSVRALSSAAATVSAVGASFLAQVHGVLDQPHGAGPDRVTSIRRLSVIAASAERQLAAIDTGPSAALVGPLARKHDEFVTQLDDARLRLLRAAGVSAAVATILQGPQTYVVLASNNAEMRAGHRGVRPELGLAQPDPGHAQPGLDPPVRRHRALRRRHVDQAHRSAGGRGDLPRRGRAPPAARGHRSGAGRGSDGHR